MIPVANIAVASSPPPTLVATPLPDSITVQRVPFDNVAPSFSSPQVGYNARGNGGIFVPAEIAPAAPAASASSGAASATTTSASGIGAPATFLAQLIGQSLPSSLGAVGNFLAEYEKMVINSYVKFGNSYATLPRPDEPSPYDKFLEQQRAAQAAPQPKPVQPQSAPPPAEQIASAPVTAAIATAATPAPVQRPQPAPQAKAQPVKDESQDAPLPSAPIKLAQAPVMVPSLAASAYQASAGRMDAPPANVAASI